jgi:CubicO group peptidase (beta-lactamase class C family)
MINDGRRIKGGREPLLENPINKGVFAIVSKKGVGNPSFILAGFIVLAALASPLGRAAGDVAPHRVSESTAIAALEAELKKQADEGRFSGAVLVAKDGQPIFQAAYGLADRDENIPNTVDTKFRFGSMGKMFTAVAAAGGGYSTIADFLRFANALASHQLLNARFTELLTTGKVRSPRGKYAYGFEDETTPDGVRRIGHGGGFPGSINRRFCCVRSTGCRMMRSPG